MKTTYFTLKGIIKKPKSKKKRIQRKWSKKILFIKESFKKSVSKLTEEKGILITDYKDTLKEFNKL